MEMLFSATTLTDVAQFIDSDVQTVGTSLHFIFTCGDEIHCFFADSAADVALKELSEQIESFDRETAPKLQPYFKREVKKVFLTGCTGFLGPFVLFGRLFVLICNSFSERVASADSGASVLSYSRQFC